MVRVEQYKRSFEEKQQQMSKQKSLEINNLYDELKQLKEEYIEKINAVKSEAEKVSKIHFIPFSESTEAIAYLVSLIEGKKYSVVTFPTLLYACDGWIYNFFYGCGCKGVGYNIVCLVDDDNKEIAEKALLEKFYINESNFFNFNDVDTQLEKINRHLNDPSDSYIQLVCYKDTDISKDVCYCPDGYKHINKQPCKGLISYISDERYSYIYDFMDSVICYRLDKDNLEVSLEEMMELAEKFAYEYLQNNKTLKKKI